MTNGVRSAGVRILAGAVVVAFVVVATLTTVVSLGEYCLTSDGGDTSALPAPATAP